MHIKGLLCKILFLLFLFSFTSNICEAQRGFFLGAEVIPHSTSLLNKDDRASEVISPQFTLRGAGGLSLAYFPTSNIGVAARALFSVQGQSYEYQYSFATERKNRVVTYMKFPILIQYRMGDVSDLYFKVDAGAEVNLVQSANHRENSNIVEPDGDEEFIDMYRKPTFGLVLAFGPGFSIKRNVQLDVQFRVDHGLTNAEEKGSALVPNTREESYNFTAGIRFGFVYEFGSKFNTNKGGYL